MHVSISSREHVFSLSKDMVSFHIIHWPLILLLPKLLVGYSILAESMKLGIPVLKFIYLEVIIARVKFNTTIETCMWSGETNIG